jgi:uncharacterized protein (TIGR02231 family)
MAEETAPSSLEPRPENPVRRRPVQTGVEEVTVYTNRARIVRRGRLTLTGDERELVVEGLPANIEASSVRASGKGTIPVRLLEVRTEHIYTAEAQLPALQELEKELRDMDEQIQAVQDERKALGLQRDFVQNLSEKAVDRYSVSLARRQTELDDTQKLLGFLGQQYLSYATALANAERKSARLHREREAIQFRYEELSGSNLPTELYNVIVAVGVQGAGDFELEVSYLTTGAGWQPLYDVRANAPYSKISLSYLAQVTQNTGEDWNNVRLTLSTAKPGYGALPPKPDPWYIDTVYPQVYAKKARLRLGSGGMAASLEQGKDASLQRIVAQSAVSDDAEYAPKPQVYQAQEESAEAVGEQGVVAFRLEQSVDIPSDGTPHRTTIFNDEYPCRLEYVAMPRLVSYAYLQAVVTNKPDGVTLLPGTANIFRDEVFNGTSPLENIAAGQEFKLSLGIDEGLKLERDLVEREVDKRLLSGQRRTTYAYRLFVTNLRDTEMTLKLTEQLPVSRNETLKVRLTTARPNIQPGEMGVLDWTLMLLPKAKREIYYQFTVEHPADQNVTGLGI